MNEKPSSSVSPPLLFRNPAVLLLSGLLCGLLLGFAISLLLRPQSPTPFETPQTQIVEAPIEPAAPSFVRVLPDGTIESPEGATVTIQREKWGGTRSLEATASSTSSGLTTNAPEIAGKTNFSSANPRLPSLFGSTFGFELAAIGVGEFTVEGSRQIYLFIGIGFLVLGAGVWYFTRSVVAPILAAVIGIPLIIVAIDKTLGILLFISMFGVGAYMLWHMYRAHKATQLKQALTKTEEEATLYDDLAHAAFASFTPAEHLEFEATLDPALKPHYYKIRGES